MSLIAPNSYFSCFTRFQSNNDIYYYLFDNCYGSLRLINLLHLSLSSCKNIMVHFSISMIASPPPPISSSMECQEQNGSALAQEYDQLDRLQTAYDLIYAISLALDHLLIIPATSVME